MDLAAALKDSYLTNDLTDDEVATIAAISEEADFDDLGEVIREFDEACHVYILLRGKARVTTGSGDPIARLKVGDIVGEIGLYSKEPRTASVVSDGPSTFLRIDGPELNALLDKFPAIGVKVLRNVGMALCAHLRSSNFQLESVLSVL